MLGGGGFDGLAIASNSTLKASLVISNCVTVKRSKNSNQNLVRSTAPKMLFRDSEGSDSVGNCLKGFLSKPTGNCLKGLLLLLLLLFMEWFFGGDFFFLSQLLSG